MSASTYDSLGLKRWGDVDDLTAEEAHALLEDACGTADEWEGQYNETQALLDALLKGLGEVWGVLVDRDQADPLLAVLDAAVKKAGGW